MLRNKNTKSEARNSKQTETFKAKNQNPKGACFEILCFLIIWIYFEFRISSFEFSLFAPVHNNRAWRRPCCAKFL